MVLPIYAYGHSVLKKRGIDIEPDFPNLDELLENMWETMYNAKGVGLAAPQIGKNLRLFLVDTLQIEDEKAGIKKAFINAEIIEEFGKEISIEEGCLSIPDIRGDVSRPGNIKIKYLDKDFKENTEEYSGFNARVIQHEYDHIEGKLFTEKLMPLRKRLIRRKLEAIKKGRVEVDYRMRFSPK